MGRNLPAGRFTGTITVVDPQVKTLVRRIRQEVAVDTFAPVANCNKGQQTIKDQIYQGTHKQADQLGKRRKNRADGCNRTSDGPIKILLLIEITTAANAAVLHATLRGKLGQCAVFLSASGTVHFGRVIR